MSLLSWWTKPSKPAISGSPRLPEDLEREIFLLTASEDARSIPTLVRVAKRTQLWLEPLLYRVLVLLEYSDGLEFIEDRLRRKPDSVWRNGPCHVYLALGDEKRSVSAVENLLGKCVGVEDLSFHPPADQPKRFLAQLDGMTNPNRLHTELQKLFDGSLSSIDLQRPAFSHLSHLMLFDELAHCTESDAAHLTQQLSLLPSITHLALAGRIPKSLVLSLLALSSVVIFVSLRQDTRLLTVQRMYDRELSGVNDLRFVIMPLGIWLGDWEKAARGAKEDFWVGAERFVEGKRRGEIDADKYWTDDEMTV
ncbi:hypothetical protein C8F01DRAFT_1156800 [Mycena amicta]|nr:hypothetical protein C8F01DRAFT_1156800 [Mycena amicta]